MSDLWEKAGFSSPRSSFGILWRHSCLLKRLICTHHTAVGKLFHVVEASDESRQNVALSFQTFEGAVTADHGESAAVTSLLLRKRRKKVSLHDKNERKRKKKNQWGWTSTARRPAVSLGSTCLASTHRGEQTSPSLSCFTQYSRTRVKVDVVVLSVFCSLF